MRVIAAFIMLVVLAVGGYVLLSGNASTLTPAAPIVQPVVALESTTTETTVYTTKAVWEFKSIEDGVSDVMNPQSDVAVSFDVRSDKGNTYTKGPFRIGAFTGSCAEQPQPYAGKDIPGATQYALCWFAGGGTELAIVPEGDSVSIVSRDVSEGSAEISAEAGDPSTVLIVDLAE